MTPTTWKIHTVFFLLPVELVIQIVLMWVAEC